MSKKSLKNASVNTIHHKLWWVIVSFFFALACILFILQSSWVNPQPAPIKSFALSAGSGAVSPEFAGSRSLVISANSCNYVVYSVKTQHRETTPCTMNPSTFNKIIASYYRNKIKTAIENNNARTPAMLAGAPVKNLAVNYENGSTLETRVTLKFQTDAQSFFSTVARLVPQFSELNF